jgi:hypothetical protein
MIKHKTPKIEMRAGWDLDLETFDLTLESTYYENTINYYRYKANLVQV